MTVPYGPGSYFGDYHTDSICLDLGECLEDFKYLSVNDYQGFEQHEDIGAIFGWARPN